MQLILNKTPPKALPVRRTNPTPAGATIEVTEPKHSFLGEK
jgi:hypothetical protein